jgi:cell wall-associated NlpC family hydrolase
VERDELEAGDLVFFNGTKKPMHVGIYLGDGKFIHASSAAKQIRTDFIDTPWQFKHFVGAVRIRELKNPRETR